MPRPATGAVVARFGSTFPAWLTEADTSRRLYPRVADMLRKCGPCHFLMMIEALREFRLGQ